jgi:ABC-2 type transport system permease protein
MLGALGYPKIGSTISHWFGLLGFTLIMLGIAWIAFRRREQNS